MCSEFINLFLNVVKECIPTKTITIRKNDKPWFNNSLRKDIRLRDRLRKRVLKTGNVNDNEKYKRQRNKVNNMKKGAKEIFEKNLDNIILENSSPKTYWKIMKMLIKSSKGSSCIPPLHNIILENNMEGTVFTDIEK